MRELVSAVRAFKSEFGVAARARALRHDSTIVGLLSLTRRALARTHLVHVASTLGRELGFGPDQLGALKIPIDLLDLFPGWRSGSTSGFRPPRSRLVLLPESCARPIGALRLQVSAAAGPVAIAATMLGDLRRTLDPAVRIVTLIEESPLPPTRIHLDMGWREFRGATRDARKVRDALLARGFVLDRDLHYVEERNARHNEGAWARRLPAALRFLLSDVGPP